MIVAKQVADFITIVRGVLGIYIAWLGISAGEETLSLAVWLMIIAWSGDALDGPIARRSRVSYHTWIGDHDLHFDIFVSGGLLVYMIGTGYLTIPVIGVYLLIWLLIFWRWGLERSLGMLVQAPIYAWFIWVAMHDAPAAGWWIIAWIAVMIVITWPRFPQEVVPGFLNGMRGLGDGEDDQ